MKIFIFVGDLIKVLRSWCWKPRTEKSRKCEAWLFLLLLYSLRQLDGEKRRIKRVSARSTRLWERPFSAFIWMSISPAVNSLNNWVFGIQKLDALIQFTINITRQNQMLLSSRRPRNQTEDRNHSFSCVLSRVTRYDFITCSKPSCAIQ